MYSRAYNKYHSNIFLLIWAIIVIKIRDASKIVSPRWIDFQKLHLKSFYPNSACNFILIMIVMTMDKLIDIHLVWRWFTLPVTVKKCKHSLSCTFLSKWNHTHYYSLLQKWDDTNNCAFIIRQGVSKKRKFKSISNSNPFTWGFCGIATKNDLHNS